LVAVMTIVRSTLNQLSDRESSLLCEQCGYPIAELPTDGPCPECGKSIRESLPEARRGSAWQRRPGVFTWIATNWRVLRHPSPLFREVRIEKRRALPLLWINLLLAAAALLAPLSGVFDFDPMRSVRGKGDLVEYGTAMVVIPLQVSAIAIVLFLLTYVEYQGIRFFSVRRGWRLTRSGAWQVCAHSSVGWMMCGLLPFLVFAAFEAALRFFQAAPRGTWDLGPMLGRWDAQSLIHGGSVALGYFVGMMVFESLVYVGVRACRYANEYRPAMTATAETLIRADENVVANA
jgi:hypothetical protein